MGISKSLSTIVLLSCVFLVYGAAVPKFDPIEHIKSLSLAAPPKLKDFPTPPDYKVEGYVDGGSLVSFTSNLTGSEKTDVLLSNLFAQLAADHQYNRFTDTANWNKRYTEVLGGIGYVIQGTQTFEQYKPHSSYTMDKAVFDLLAATVPHANATLNATRKTLDSLKSLATTDSRRAAFVQKSYSSKTGDFQVLAGTKSDKTSKDIAVLIGHFYFHSTKDVSQYLFANWDSHSMSLYRRASVVTFNLEQYSAVRSTIEKKLEDKGVLKTLIGNLKI